MAFVLFAYVAVRQHDTFHTRARDMGIYAQVMWNTSHGRPFASTLLADNSPAQDIVLARFMEER